MYRRRSLRALRCTSIPPRVCISIRRACSLQMMIPGYVNEQRYFGWVIVVFLFLLLNHLVLHLSPLQNHAFFPFRSFLDDEFIYKKV